jgi:hypothetical protein
VAPDHLGGGVRRVEQVAAGPVETSPKKTSSAHCPARAIGDERAQLRPGAGEDVLAVAVREQAERAAALDDREDLEAPLGREQPGRGGVARPRGSR